MSDASSNLRVSLVQTDLVWDSPLANCGHVTVLLHVHN